MSVVRWPGHECQEYLYFELDQHVHHDARGKESDEGFTLMLLPVPPHVWVRLSRSGYVPGLVVA